MKNVLKLAGALMSALLAIPFFTVMWIFEAGTSYDGKINSTTQNYKLFDELSSAKNYFSMFGKTLNESLYTVINWLCVIAVALAVAYIVFAVLSFFVKEKFISNAITAISAVLLLIGIAALIIILIANSVNSYTGSIITGAFYKVKAAAGAWLFAVFAILSGLIGIASQINPAACPFRKKRKKAKK